MRVIANTLTAVLFLALCSCASPHKAALIETRDNENYGSLFFLRPHFQAGGALSVPLKQGDELLANLPNNYYVEVRLPVGKNRIRTGHRGSVLKQVLVNDFVVSNSSPKYYFLKYDITTAYTNVTMYGVGVGVVPNVPVEVITGGEWVEISPSEAKKLMMQMDRDDEVRRNRKPPRVKR